MAHNILNINGRDSIAYIDATPWHGLGANILSLMLKTAPAERVDLALEQAGMNYRVGSETLHLPDGTPVPSHRAAVRYNADGTVAAQLGVVGKDHVHIQNSRAVDIARAMCEEFDVVPACTAALGNGERCFMLLRMSDATITPVPGDDVRGYNLLYWGHDGQVALQDMATGIRVVCQNTLNMAISAAGGKHGKRWISIKHTSSADQRIDEAAKLMKQLMATIKTTGDTFRKLAETPMNRKQLEAYIAAVIPAAALDSTGRISDRYRARRDAIAALMAAGKGADMANQLVGKGEVSAWGAYNAVTEYFDHVRPAEAQSDAGKRNATVGAIFGDAADVKLSAFTLARQLVAA